MGFESIIGHEFIKNQIQNSINNNTFSHAHLIVGPDGIGKSLLAYQVAIKILGKNENRDYVDIVEWRVKKNKKSIGVDEIRSLIIEVNKKPYEGSQKVVIIYEAHKMTTEAQNAILKTIEEPPKGVTIIMCSESLDLLLETIKSRNQIHRLNRLKANEIKLYLQKKYEILTNDEMNLLINFSDGIPGRCDLYLNDADFKEVRNFTLSLIKSVGEDNIGIMQEYESYFNKYNYMWEEIIDTLLSYIRDIMIYKEIGDNNIIINYDKLNDIMDMANLYSMKKLDEFIGIINEAREKLQSKVNSELVFAVMFLKMQEV
ncbi:DNA polymerase III subunit delta' [Clostridium grantii]|uniref:DNA polymerase III subunit delta' n=1 Tax=Clostridium grantii DSM 8605 TaxID=1121316 RepID=A0A1M5XR71_9CLOT|nr:DNA polymerase III subunit delta' [Clostridium grantii]SHI02246.1 DNA polymerase-3 subunit delta' [Clostridium grantii DSM 8605]